MSRLEELIAELCPEGADYYPLKAVCSITKGVQFNKSNMNEEGSYPVINGGINPSGYIELYNQDENTITISQGGASAGYVNWVNQKFWAGAHCYILKPGSCINNRYLFHFVKSKEYKLQECQYGAGIPALGRATLDELRIPLPPLEVQREIVRVLDNFTILTAELTAELTARKKQYEYYRNQLLSYNDSVKWVKIGDVCNIYTGGEPPIDCIKGNLPDDKHPYAVWGNGKDVYGYSGSYRIDTDAVVISSIGANTGTVYFHKAFFTPIIRLKVIVPKEDTLDMRFLFHAMSATKIESKSSSVPNMNAAEIKALSIPLPPIKEQKRIAIILDKFDNLCDDLSSGIPAEIATRQIQYQFYRDKLLSFKEKQGL